MWVIPAIVSSLLLGFYDIFKKLSLKDNAVLPVLLTASSTSAMIFLPLILLSAYVPSTLEESLFFVPAGTLENHLLIFLKSNLVASSWIFAFFAVKHLPITIVSPIRSSGPAWTLIGALTIFGEKLNLYQWGGLIITFGCYYFFSVAGKKEGIHFTKNKWVLFMIVATILGAVSSLYDKFLVSKMDRMFVQAWFAVYMVFVLVPVVYFMWYKKSARRSPFSWSPYIPLIGIFLSMADFAYFFSLSMDGALISLVSAIRRSSVVYTFILGGLILHETNLKAKAWVLLGILIGVGLIVLGS